MIRYGLLCAAGHEFDGWFRSSSDFDAQAGDGMLGCPFCGSAKVAKALMAPAVRTRSASGAAISASESASEADRPTVPGTGSAPDAAVVQPVAILDEKHQKIREMLREIKGALTKNSDDVGDRFPEIARKMHTEEIERRSIHGRATPEEAKALAEEGVEIQRLPSFPDELN